MKMTKYIANSFKTFGRSFLLCGLCGWCMEILFTALHSLRRRDLRLTGNTSLWMFPIYGCAAFIGPVSRLLRKKNLLFRGNLYMLGIFLVEFFTGSLLKKKNWCPWDYGDAPLNIHGVIRLDYAPLWLLAGLFFEHVQNSTKKGGSLRPSGSAT